MLHTGIDSLTAATPPATPNLYYFPGWPNGLRTGLLTVMVWLMFLNADFVWANELSGPDQAGAVEPAVDGRALDGIDFFENLLRHLLPPFDQLAANESEHIAPVRVATNPVNIKLSDQSLGKSATSAEQSSDLDQELTTESHIDLSVEPLFEFTSAEIHRFKRIERCLAMYYRLPVDAEKWRPWTIMHGLLPYGRLSTVVKGNQRFNAVEYLCHNGIGNDKRLLYLSNGELAGQIGPGFQGHEGQLLAMLAQSDVPLDQPIYVQGMTFSVADLIEYEKQGCRQNSELTFKLIGLAHYLESDTVWRNSIGQAWNIERLIFEEIKQPINGAACGGTHRLMGLSYAVNRRALQQQPLDGQWARARNFIAQYQEFAMRYQNADGSFSTNWFVTQEADHDRKKRLYTTGHIVEWLVYSLPNDKLRDPRLDRAVDYLLDLMLTASALDLEYGPRGHALHALRIYERRMLGRNTDVQNIPPDDLAIVEQATLMQRNLKPSFDSKQAGTPVQGVGYPSNQPQGGSSGRRGFRRW